MRTALAALVLTLLLAAAAPGRAAYKSGFYVGIGLGYASVSGERGIPLETYSACPTVGPLGGPFLWHEPGAVGVTCIYASPTPTHDAQTRFSELVRTDAGSGLGFQLRLGWNFKGYASLEIAFAGNGKPNGKEGIGMPALQVRYHPAEHFIRHMDRDWDVNVYGGFGYAIAGYHPDEDIQGNDDGKGWEGIHYSMGLAFDYAVTDAVSLGLDVRIALPRYLSWIVNFDKDYRAIPTETPSTLVVTPTFNVTFHP